MHGWVWMVGCAVGKESDALPTGYGAAWEGSIVKLVNAGFTHIYVNEQLVFVVTRQKRDYLKDTAFRARVCAMSTEGKSRKEIARELRVNIQVIVSVLRREAKV